MATRLGPAPEQCATVALDVGGTEIKGAIRDAAGDVVEWRRWSTPRADGADAVVRAVLDAAAELLALAPDSAAVGLVVPGTVDASAGVALYSENIGWRDVPFRALLAESSGLPVGFGHDVRAGGLAERTLGAARGVDDVLFLAMGTGISGAMVVEGHVLEGMFAGEIGHLDVGSDRLCACGLTGCLETVATGPSIAKLYEEHGGSPVAGSKPVVERMLAGDTAAAAAWSIAVEGTARALASYVSLLAPELVVVGGGLSAAGDVLLEPLRRELDAKLLWQPRPRLVVAELGDLAGNVGAHLLAVRAAMDAARRGSAS